MVETVYGLSPSQMAQVLAVIEGMGNIERALLFGSRASGEFNEGSDVDIAIDGKEVNEVTAASLTYELEEGTYLPYFFDIVSLPTLQSASLRAQIRETGIEIWPKSSGV
jgi:uncharacterized protein